MMENSPHPETIYSTSTWRSQAYSSLMMLFEKLQSFYWWEFHTWEFLKARLQLLVICRGCPVDNLLLPPDGALATDPHLGLQHLKLLLVHFDLWNHLKITLEQKHVILRVNCAELRSGVNRLRSSELKINARNYCIHQPTCAGIPLYSRTAQVKENKATKWSWHRFRKCVWTKFWFQDLGS